MSLKQLNFFFTKLQLNIIKKKIQFEYPEINSDLQNILQKMQNYHFISGYKLDFNQHKTIIFLSYDKQSLPIITSITIVSTIRRRQIISLENIKVFLKNYPTALALTRTNKGILSFKECLTLKRGGEFLVIII